MSILWPRESLREKSVEEGRRCARIMLEDVKFPKTQEELESLLGVAISLGYEMGAETTEDLAQQVFE